MRFCHFDVQRLLNIGNREIFNKWTLFYQTRIISFCSWVIMLFLYFFLLHLLLLMNILFGRFNQVIGYFHQFGMIRFIFLLYFWNLLVYLVVILKSLVTMLWIMRLIQLLLYGRTAFLRSFHDRIVQACCFLNLFTLAKSAWFHHVAWVWHFRLNIFCFQ